VTFEALGRGRAEVDGGRHFGPDEGDLSGDALDADEVVEMSRGQGSCGHVTRAEASLEADVELLALLGIGRVHRSHIFFEGTL